MTIEVTIPGMLRDCVNGRTKFTIEAETFSQALEVMRRDYPVLRAHVWLDSGALRPHVLLFYNDTSTRWLETLDIPLKTGDRIQIVQAVSGG